MGGVQWRPGGDSQRGGVLRHTGDTERNLNAPHNEEYNCTIVAEYYSSRLVKFEGTTRSTSMPTERKLKQMFDSCFTCVYKCV